ncbi:MAG: universal stress protein [Methanothrix sp.]|jgi:nucleotide-binding universal stress UspA family protein|nr:universal stress protein [Methanomicrobia archaeon]MDD1727214.1 universal stress protein [Methanothrix sp.]MRR35452.1 universal stress protein [bacterium]OYV12465.1 MAG: universal stress protein [Methanosaeta sp. ASO1]OYV14250.1 MAG: universal stress protein [Methanosaeta sp. NSM2]
MFEKILVATDGSEHGYRAARVALELGKISGGKVTAIYVADTVKTSHLPDDMLLFSIRELLLKEGKEALKQVESLAQEKGVAFESLVVEGNPGSEIIRSAEASGMDIIILGAVGRTGLDKFLLGSVAEKVVRNSKIPVLTVPREQT